MVDQHPFLLKALTGIKNKTLLCQQHLKVAFDFLLPLARTCFSFFEQFIEQQMV
jgi:hypothetical protein